MINFHIGYTSINAPNDVQIKITETEFDLKRGRLLL